MVLHSHHTANSPNLLSLQLLQTMSSHLKIWSWGFPMKETIRLSSGCELPNSIWSFRVVIALGYHPEVESTPLLLKTLYSTEMGSKDSWAETDLKALSLQPSFYGTKRHHTSFQRREITNNPTQTGLWITTMRNMLWQPQECNNSTHKLVTTKSLLIGFKTCPTRDRPCLVLENR